MKKIIVSVLSVIICLSALSGCSGKTFTAYELYELSLNSINEAGGFKVENYTSVEAYDMDYSNFVSSNVEVNGDNWHLDSYASYIDWHIDMCVVDGMMYVTDDYDKIVFAAGEGETAPPISDYLPELTPELLEGVEVSKTADGYGFSIEPTDGILRTAFEGMLAEFVGDDVTRENSVMTFSFNAEGIIVSIEYTGEMSSDDFLLGAATAYVSAECKFIDAGTAPKVTAPADADEYELVE